MSTFTHSSEPVAPVPSASVSPAEYVPGTPEQARNSYWRSGILLGLTLVILLAYWFNPPLNVQPQAGVVMDLPPLVDDYYGAPGKITKAELDILPKDTEFARRIYADGKGHEINCSIVLSGSEQRSIHRPEACLVGQGWTVIDQKNIPVPLQSGHKLVARELTLERRVNDQNGQVLTVRAFYIYWFVGQNVTTPSHFTRILLSNWDRAVLNVSHRWAYVSVFAMITDNLRPDGLDPAQTESLLTHFATRIVPSFQISEMPQTAGR
jgi:hypothetical protein